MQKIFCIWLFLNKTSLEKKYFCFNTQLHFLFCYNTTVIQIKKGAIQMILSILEFFQNLPSKYCQKCGEEIEEQHECYGNVCHKCIGLKDMD